MRATFHIGVPKTGTTALQNSLHAARGALARHGILYPSLERFGHLNHHPLILGILPPEKLPRQFRYKSRFRRDLLARRSAGSVAREIAMMRPEHLLLSSEYFSRPFGPAEIDRLRALLDGFGIGDLVFSVYVRRPSAQYLSLLTQLMRLSSTIRPPEPFRIRPRIETLRRAFPAASVVPAISERDVLIEGDIVADFTARFLAPLGVGTEEVPSLSEANVSVSGESTDILSAFRRDAFPGRDNRPAPASSALFDTLAAIEARIGRRRPRLRPEVAAHIDAASQDVDWLDRTFGLSFPGLEAGPRPKADLPPPRTLGDVIEIDGDYRARLLAELEQSPWARRPWRRAWVRDLAAGAAPRRVLPWF